MRGGAFRPLRWDERDHGWDGRDVRGMARMLGFAPMSASARSTRVALAAASFLALLEIFRSGMNTSSRETTPRSSSWSTG